MLGLVGESGSGKSVTLRSIVRLLRPPLQRHRPGALAAARSAGHAGDGSCNASAAREIAMIFQEPMTALNPVLTVGVQIDESLQRP